MTLSMRFSAVKEVPKSGTEREEKGGEKDSKLDHFFFGIIAFKWRNKEGEIESIRDRERVTR